MELGRKEIEVAFVATSVNKPTELFIADWDGKNERRLTGFNDKLNAEVGWADAGQLPPIKASAG